MPVFLRGVFILTVFFILLAAEIIFAVGFIIAGYPKSTKKGFAFKMIASSIFLINGIMAYLRSDNLRYATLVTAGLAFGLLGDIFMTIDPFIKNKQSKKLPLLFVILGGAFFLLGHGAYIAAFIVMIKQKSAFDLTLFAVTAAVTLAAVLLIGVLLRIKPVRLLPGVVIYAAAVCCVLAAAVCLGVKGYPDRPIIAAVLISAPALFIISDSTLAIKAFDKERFGTLTLRAVNLGTYFLAQMLFGLSVYLI